MRISIDGYELNRTYTGVGRYLHNLLKALLKADTENEYILYLTEELPLELEAANLKVKVVTGTSHTKWQNGPLLSALRQDTPDLFFSPNHSLPFMWKGPSVMTVHDVSWKVVKRDFSLKERVIRNFKTSIALRRSKKVFTVSQFSKDETVKHYKADPSKIFPIHSGIEDSFERCHDAEIDSFREKYGIGEERVIGFLGSIFPRRHVMELIRAWQTVKKEIPCKLMICGKNFCGADLERICSSDPDIVRIERIDEEQLNTFYSSLDLFAYLSSYEGFGFPPMEALQCGTVPLLLNSSSLAEIYPEMAVFSETASPSDIAESLKTFLENPDGVKASVMENWVMKREYYSWERAAAEYLKHIESL